MTKMTKKEKKIFSKKKKKIFFKKKKFFFSKKKIVQKEFHKKIYQKLSKNQ